MSPEQREHDLPGSLRGPFEQVMPCAPLCQHGRPLSVRCLRCIALDVWVYEALPSEFQRAMRRRPVGLVFASEGRT
jgi:hypothetical protein